MLQVIPYLPPCASTGCLNPAASVGVLLGNGDGTFQTAVTYESGGYGGENEFTHNSVAVADVNGDGLPDVVVAISCTGHTTSGLATFRTSLLKVGTHSIRATYAGDTTFKPSSGAVKQVVTLYPSTTKLTSSPNPSTYGHAITLTAKVTSGAPGGPTGTVALRNGSSTLGSATLSSGIAHLMTAKLPAGTLTITAIYNGDSQSAKSTGTTTQTVKPAANATSLTSSTNTSSAGQTVKFTATVTSPTTTPVGSVNFLDGSTTLATRSLIGGKASYSTSALTKGTHNMTAVYADTANITASKSPRLVQTVN